MSGAGLRHITPKAFHALVPLGEALYFDRYTKLLAPDLDPLRDERVSLGNVIDV